MGINRIKCWLGTRMNWGMGTPISGHRYAELCDNADVHVLKCMECGKVSTAFYFDPDERLRGIIE